MQKPDAIPTSIAAEKLICTTRHIQNLFWRGDLTGYFKGAGRGLMIYRNSIDAFKKKNNFEYLSELPESPE